MANCFSIHPPKRRLALLAAVLASCAVRGAPCAVPGAQPDTAAPPPSAAHGAPRTAHASEASPAPRLVLEQTEAELPEHEPGTPMEFVFHLKNTGTAPLQIKVKPSCGCLVADYDREIRPGGTGSISASFNSQGIQGPVVKYLTLYTNDPEKPEQLLTLKTSIVQLLEVSPSGPMFVMSPGKSAEEVVTFHSLETAPFKILKLESNLPFVKTEILPEEAPSTDAPADALSRQQVRITVLTSAPPREFAGTVTVTTNSPRRPSYVVNVSGHPLGWVEVLPAQLYFDAVPAHLDQPLSRPIVLMKREGSFQVLSAASSDPLLHLEVMPNIGGRYCEVTVRYAGGWKPGVTKGKIVIKTSDPLRPRVEIPFRAEVGMD